MDVGTTKARVPKALKEQRGSLNVTRENKNQPNSPSTLPSPPELSEHERWAWNKFAKVIRPMRITTEEDFASLELLAKLYSQWVLLNKELNTHPKLTYEEATKFGTTRKILPEFTAMRKVEPMLVNLMGRFGLTPADRSRVSVIRDGSDVNTDPENEFGAN